MGRVLEVIGWLLIIGTMALLIAAAGRLPPGDAGIQGAAMMLWGGPPIFVGILVIVFGSMLTELSAIRRNGERQAELLLNLVSAPRKSENETPPNTYRATAPRLLTGESQCPNCGRVNRVADQLCECGLSIRP